MICIFPERNASVRKKGVGIVTCYWNAGLMIIPVLIPGHKK